MARPRTPLKKAKITGQDKKHPEVFNERRQPSVRPLGEPSDFMHGVKNSENQLKAWEAFKSELPWLNESDRALVEVACNLRARFFTGEEVGVQAVTALRQCVSAMGGTPSDLSRVDVPNDKEESKADKYFN